MSRSEYYRELNRQKPNTEAGHREHTRKLAKLASLLREIAMSLVREPDEIMVKTCNDNGIYLFTLHSAKEDVGILLGRQHLTYHALKRVLQAAGQRTGISADLKVAGYEPQRRAS